MDIDISFIVFANNSGYFSHARKTHELSGKNMIEIAKSSPYSITDEELTVNTKKVPLIGAKIPHATRETLCIFILFYDLELILSASQTNLFALFQSCFPLNVRVRIFEVVVMAMPIWLS